MGVTNAQLETLRKFAETQNAKANVIVNILGLYPLEADVMITFADWEKMGKPQLSADEGIKFVTPQADKPAFGNAIMV